MFREKLVTIIIGLVVGALLAGLFFFGPKLVSKESLQPTASPAPSIKDSITPTPKKVSLKLTSPENNSSTLSSKLKLKGTAAPNAKLVIFANADEKTASAGANGKFDIEVKLEEGENEISVTDLTEPIQTVTRNVTLEITE